MTMLGTIARGLRSRALLSVGSALLVALAVGAAVLGPMFSVAVTRSYAVTRINEAPAALTGTSWVFAPDSRAIDGRSQAVTLATEAVAAAGGSPHARPVVSLESERFPALTGQVMLLAVEGACEHLQVEGRCPVRQGEALMSEIDLPAVGVEIGDQVDLGGSVGLVTVVGSYRAPTEDDFWFQPLRLGSMPAHGDDRTGVSAAFQPAPLVVVASTFDRLPSGSWTVRVDNRLRVPPDFTPAGLTALAHATGDRPAVGAQQRVEGGTLRLDSADDLAAVAREVGSEQRAATDSIAPAVISLVLVALALLTRLLLAASELRVPELALASLRGMAERRLWALGLAEPLALLVVAAPVGAVLGVVMTWGLVRAWLVPGLPLIVPTASLLGAVLVTAAGAVVAALAVGTVLRTSLSAQLAGVRRPRAARRTAQVGELLLVAVAVAVVLARLVAGAGGRPDLGDLVLPVLVAVVAGLAASRLVAGVATWQTRRPASRSSLGGFVAARALSRRREGTLVIVPVTVAIAIGVFSMGVYTAAATWRDSVASTRSPADVVWSSPLPLRATFDLTHRLDPEGRWLMMASTMDAVGGRVVAVDAPRMARVLHWPDQWTPGLGAAEIGELIAPAAERPFVTGTRLGLSVDRAAEVDGPLWVELRLRSTGPDGMLRPAYLEALEPGLSTRTVRVPECREGCWLEGITVAGPAGRPIPMAGEVTLGPLTVDGEPVPGLISQAGLVTSPDVPADDRFGQIAVEGDRLRVSVDTVGSAGQVRLVTGGVPTQRPVVVGTDGLDNLVAGEDGPAIELTGERLPVDIRRESRSVPLLGPEGLLVDYTMLTTGREIYDQIFHPSVLARADAPPGLAQALADRGFTVATTRADQARTLGNGAYALALRLYLVVAGLVLAMAVAGLVVSSAVQLPSRRRDAASLRVVGVPRRQVMWAVALEFVVVLGAAAVAGILAGTLAQDLVLSSVRLGYADALDTPDLVVSIDAQRLALWALGTAAVLAGGALLSAGLTVRGARGATLRENAR